MGFSVGMFSGLNPEPLTVCFGIYLNFIQTSGDECKISGIKTGFRVLPAQVSGAVQDCNDLKLVIVKQRGLA